MSAVYTKYVSTPVHPVQFPKQTRILIAQLIILLWYPYVSLFPDLLCNIGLSVSGLRKIRFNAYTQYTPRRISTKNQFQKKPGFQLSALIILDCSNVNLNYNHDQQRLLGNPQRVQSLVLWPL